MDWPVFFLALSLLRLPSFMNLPSQDLISHLVALSSCCRNNVVILDQPLWEIFYPSSGQLTRHLRKDSSDNKPIDSQLICNRYVSQLSYAQASHKCLTK